MYFIFDFLVFLIPLYCDRFRPKIPKPITPQANVRKIQNNRSQNTQYPKLPKAKIPKSKTTIPFKQIKAF